MALVTDQSLLSTELEEEDEEFRRILLQATQKIQSSMPPSTDSKPIRPQPGFCIKTHAGPGEKIFVNVCKSSHIPPPPDLSNQELESLIKSENASSFRIPMSLGEPHAELDKSGSGCTAYDVTIHTSFFNKLEGDRLFKEFFIMVALEGLSEKYKTDINHPEWHILKNRKFLGSISEQTIRTKSRPIIQELESNSLAAPQFTIVAEPSTNHPNSLKAEFCLPKVDSVEALELDLGEDRVVLRGHPRLYHLDLFLPYSIVPEESQARFHRKAKVLRVTMPVQHF